MAATSGKTDRRTVLVANRDFWIAGEKVPEGLELERNVFERWDKEHPVTEMGWQEYLLKQGWIKEVECEETGR